MTGTGEGRNGGHRDVVGRLLLATEKEVPRKEGELYQAPGREGRGQGNRLDGLTEGQGRRERTSERTGQHEAQRSESSGRGAGGMGRGRSSTLL